MARVERRAARRRAVAFAHDPTTPLQNRDSASVTRSALTTTACAAVDPGPGGGRARRRCRAGGLRPTRCTRPAEVVLELPPPVVDVDRDVRSDGPEPRRSHGRRGRSPPDRAEGLGTQPRRAEKVECRHPQRARSLPELSGMETRRWINPSQPQTLQIAVFLLYINAFFSVLGGLPRLDPLGPRPPRLHGRRRLRHRERAEVGLRPRARRRVLALRCCAGCSSGRATCSA